MLQEQYALTAKALGWKASFQSGFGAQYCRTDWYCSLNAHSDILVRKFWNSPMHKAVCPSHCFLISSIPLYLLSKHQLESHLNITKEAKSCVFSYTMRATQNWEKTSLMPSTFNNSDTNIFFLKLYFCMPRPLPDDKDVREWAATFPTSLLLPFYIHYNHLPCTWLLWITTIAREQGLTEHAKQGWHISSARCLHKGRVMCKVPIRECFPADGTRHSS